MEGRGGRGTGRGLMMGGGGVVQTWAHCKSSLVQLLCLPLIPQLRLPLSPSFLCASCFRSSLRLSPSASFDLPFLYLIPSLLSLFLFFTRCLFISLDFFHSLSVVFGFPLLSTVLLSFLSYSPIYPKHGLLPRY